MFVSFTIKHFEYWRYLYQSPRTLHNALPSQTILVFVQQDVSKTPGTRWNRPMCMHSIAGTRWNHPLCMHPIVSASSFVTLFSFSFHDNYNICYKQITRIYGIVCVFVFIFDNKYNYNTFSRYILPYDKLRRTFHVS